MEASPSLPFKKNKKNSERAIATTYFFQLEKEKQLWRSRRRRGIRVGDMTNTQHRMREIVRSDVNNLVLGTDSTADFHVNLSRQYHGIQQVNLISAAIPITFYTVTTLNNILRYGATSLEVTPGDYTISELVSAIQVGLSLDNTTFPSGGVTVTRGVNTNKVTIAATDSFPMLLSNSTRSIAPLLGFLLEDRNTATSHTSQNVFNLATPLAFIVTIDQLPGGDAPSTFLRLLPISGDSGELLLYTRTLDIPDRVFLNPLSLSQIRVRITDEAGISVNLNGAGVLLLLELVITA